MIRIPCRRAWRYVAGGVPAVLAVAVLAMPAAAGHRRQCSYPPGEAGRLQFLIDTRSIADNPYYTPNVYRRSRHYDPFLNPFRSSRHYQRKLAGSHDAYVLRVFRQDDGRHDGGGYGFPAGAYGSRARQVAPCGAPASGLAYASFEPALSDVHPGTCDACRARATAPSAAGRDRIDPDDIEYRVINLVEPEPSQRPVLEQVVGPDGRRRTVIRSVPIDAAAPGEAAEAPATMVDAPEPIVAPRADDAQATS